ncbi:AP-4 complex subunit mu-like [Pyrus ussuriensis x Pyrus communis]|uniref:AP-4 complex subunit mu-like n=1 Tax=Pyrus ussuriensis x Pyrus communis TaxID=2448454 RepID=A0A5N5HPS5_9ROSA|nr:AP-4 complex subunit mu-like [Pyrus ussuriensis x Pyrus communis]
MDDESQHLPPDFALLTLARRPTDIFNRRDPSFFLAGRGFNDRGGVPKGSAEVFFRKVKVWKDDGDGDGDAPPVFSEFVSLSCFGILRRISGVVKDYLGSLAKNRCKKISVFKVLHFVTYVCVILLTCCILWESYVFNEPVVVDPVQLLPPGSVGIFTAKRMPVTTIAKSVVANERGGRKREEIFVDVIEKMSVTFSSSVRIYTSEIDGTIQLKSYLTDYILGTGVVILDDCNFHESLHLDSFDDDRTLTLVPPDGEFPVINYRFTQEFKPSFRINAFIEETGLPKADFPSSIIADKILVQIPLPAYTANAYLRVRAKLILDFWVSFELEPGELETQLMGLLQCLTLLIVGLQAKLTFSQESLGNITKEAGPLSMTFTIPMVSAALNFQILGNL